MVTLVAVPSAAQFGVAQKKDADRIQALLQQDKRDDLVSVLMEVANAQTKILDQQDAIDLAAILKQAAHDPEMQEMIARMQKEEKEL